jgi:hypothetical protein
MKSGSGQMLTTSSALKFDKISRCRMILIVSDLADDEAKSDTVIPGANSGNGPVYIPPTATLNVTR